MREDPVKVTFCSYDSPTTIGGPFSWMERLFPLLRQRGIDARALFLLHENQPGPTLKRLQSEGFQCCASPAQETTQQRVRWILEQVRSDPPDVFVPNLVVAAYHAIPWIRKAGIPSIGILHSDDLFYHDLRRRFASGNRSRMLDALVCVSKEIEAISKGDCDSMVDLHRIPYGVPLPDLSSREISDTLRLCYVGRFSEEQKRISEVTHSLCRATEALPATQATMIGDGPDRASVDRIIAEKASDLPVTVTGAIPSSQVQNLLLNHDILVLLSDYEGLPIAVLEGMACGVVPICLRMRSGVSELIEDGVTGLIVDDRGDSFLAAVRRLRHNPDLLQLLSKNARLCIENSFSLEHCAGRWAELITSFARKSNRHTSISIPRRIRLNPALPGFAHQDPRPESLLQQTQQRASRLRFYLGKWKKQLLGQPSSQRK